MYMYSVNVENPDMIIPCWDNHVDYWRARSKLTNTYLGVVQLLTFVSLSFAAWCSHIKSCLLNNCSLQVTSMPTCVCTNVADRR